MAETFQNSGGGVAPAANAPFLRGEFIPSIDLMTFSSGLRLITPWGGGSTIRQSMMDSVALSASAGAEGVSGDWARQMADLVATMAPMGDIINYNFEGLIGPAGPPGQVGPQGPPALPYLGGGAGTPSTVVTSDIPITDGIVFTDAGAGKVTWSTGTLRYKGVNYTISAEGTGDTNRYIYWNKDSTPTSLLTTDTLATAIGADKWIMCYNDGGTNYKVPGLRVFHGGVIQADTITATNIVANTITYDELRQTSGSEAVDTDAIRDDATAIYESASSAAYGGSIAECASTSTLQTVTIVSVGGTIDVNASCELHNYDGQARTANIYLYRDAVILWQDSYSIGAGADKSVTVSVVDVPGAGSTVYALLACITAAGTDVQSRYNNLSCRESLGK